MPKAKVGWWAAWQLTERIFARKRVICPRDYREYGVPHTWLHHFAYFRNFRKVGHGLYAHFDDLGPLDPRVLLTRKYRQLTLGLTSALWVQGVLKDEPTDDWWVMNRNDPLPRRPLRRPNMEFVRSSWPLEDRLEVDFGGTTIHVQSVLRATLECVRFRRRLGEEVAETAVRRALEADAVTVEALMCRAEELHVLAPLRAMLRRAARALAPATQSESAASVH